MRKWKLCVTIGLAVLALGVFLSLGQSQSGTVRFGTGMTSVAMESPDLLIAVPLANLGTATADSVTVTGVSLGTQQRLRPTALPLVLGSIAGGENSVLQLAFSAAGMTSTSRYMLVIQGTYHAGTSTLGFQVTRAITVPPAEGSSDTVEYTVDTQTTDGTVYPPDERPITDDDSNPEDQPPLPHGMQQVGELLPTDDGQDPSPDSAVTNALLRRMTANAPLSFIRKATQPNGFTLDHSGVSVDVPGAVAPTRFVFLTGNTYALLSTDGGSHFTAINPQTVFPNPPAGSLTSGPLCCDQVVHYIPSINRVVWLLQYKIFPILYDSNGKPAYGFNMLRIAAASPETIIANGGTNGWKYWDFTTSKFALGVNWMDYPDMAYTNKYLHVGVDSVGVGYFVFRIPLADIAAGGSTVHTRKTPPTAGVSAYGAHLAQDSPDAAYWFGHESDHTIRVFEWRDDSTTSTSRTVEVTSWVGSNSGDLLAYWTPTPSGADWLSFGFGQYAIRGATVVKTDSTAGITTRTIKIAWTGGRGGGFPWPHIRLVDVVRTELPGMTLWTATNERQIWSSNFAYARPYLTTNGDGDVGIALAFGGPSQDATALAGIVGDHTMHFWHKNNWSTGRWSDYTTIRKHWPNTSLFSVSDFYMTAKVPFPSSGSCCDVWHQYRLFGRTASVGNTY